MVIIDTRQVKKLEDVIAKYSEIHNERESLIKTFRFEKPLASIELYHKDSQKVLEIMKELEEFFFVAYVHIERHHSEELLFMSRFRNLVDVAEIYAKDYNGFFDEYADISGLLFGYSTNKIAEYCSQERLQKFNLIK